GPVNRQFTYGTQSATFQLDQPGDSIRLFHFTTTNYAGHAYFGLAGKAGASFVGFNNDCGFEPQFWVSNLEKGQFLSFQAFVRAHTGLVARAGHLCNGQFNRGGIGYIGFKFNNGSGDQYGWVRIQTRGNFSRNFILRDYAYGDVGDRVK